MCTYITSRFLTYPLDLVGNQIDTLMLLRNIFRETFLEDDVKILVLAEQVPGPCIGIPFVDIVDKCWEQGIGSII